MICNHYNEHTKLCKITKRFCLVIAKKGLVNENQRFTITIMNILSFVKLQNVFV
jgi:hypothetical protein